MSQVIFKADSSKNKSGLRIIEFCGPETIENTTRLKIDISVDEKNIVLSFNDIKNLLPELNKWIIEKS